MTTSWLPVPESHRRLAVAVQEADGESVLNTLRRLIRWRRRHPALTEGGLTLVEMSPDIVAFERTGGGQDILCLFNPSAAHHRLTPPPGRKPAEGVGYRIVGGELMLEPWGAVFLVP